jgi:oligosaccharide repeat unit polymerase
MSSAAGRVFFSVLSIAAGKNDIRYPPVIFLLGSAADLARNGPVRHEEECPMLFLTTVILVLLTFVNYRVGGKGILYPPVVFCAVWAVDIFLIWIMGDYFYPILPQTLMIFVGGALAFSLASGITWTYLNLKPNTVRSPQESSKRTLNILVLLVLCAGPLGYQYISGLAAQSNFNSLTAVAVGLMDETRQSDPQYSLFMNLLSFSLIVAMIAFREAGQGRMRAAIAVAFTMGINLLTGGRSVIAMLVFSMVALSWLRDRRVHWKFLIVLAMVTLILFSAVAIALGKADARTDASLVDNAGPLAQGLVLYACGGVVAFDRLIREPNLVPFAWRIDQFFVLTMNKFGTHFEAPSNRAAFVTIGPHGAVQNIFTIYFAYLEWGTAGMMVLIAFIGFVTTLVYKRAMEGSSVASLIYGALFTGLLLSPYAEYFFLNLNLLVKLYAVAWLVYCFPSWWTGFRERTRRSVAIAIAMNHPDAREFKDA